MLLHDLLVPERSAGRWLHMLDGLIRYLSKNKAEAKLCGVAALLHWFQHSESWLVSVLAQAVMHLLILTAGVAKRKLEVPVEEQWRRTTRASHHDMFRPIA